MKALVCFLITDPGSQNLNLLIRTSWRGTGQQPPGQGLPLLPVSVLHWDLLPHHPGKAPWNWNKTLSAEESGRLTILHRSHKTPCRLLRHCACAAVWTQPCHLHLHWPGRHREGSSKESPHSRGWCWGVLAPRRPSGCWKA